MSVFFGEVPLCRPNRLRFATLAPRNLVASQSASLCKVAHICSCVGPVPSVDLSGFTEREVTQVTSQLGSSHHRMQQRPEPRAGGAGGVLMPVALRPASGGVHQKDLCMIFIRKNFSSKRAFHQKDHFFPIKKTFVQKNPHGGRMGRYEFISHS